MEKHHNNDVLCSAEHDNSKTGVTMLVSSETYLWSISISTDVALKNSDSSSMVQFGDSCISNDEIMHDNSQLFEISHFMFNAVDPQFCSDINSCVPADIISYLKIGMSASESGVVKSSVSLEEETDIYNGNVVLSSGISHSDLLLPEGDLLSFHGQVVAIHDSSASSFVAHLLNGSSVDVHQPIFSRGTSTICIHVIVEHQLAVIFDTLGKHKYPTGFGPGVDAAFHRVLVLGVLLLHVSILQL
ncbi:hypothetical protein ACH5RR_027272 [Cinchona calisaya]|uniref:CST complex subunit CTC1 n=1 Tax=Cinchona calisaya TaxID=153742 RepID=A0ABD2Z895_9GENT